MELKDLLAQVADGQTSADDALEQLKTLPYEDLSFAKVDHHRHIRSGFPEVVYCERKTPEQIRDIMKAIHNRAGLVLGTRASAEQYEVVRAALPEAVYHEVPRCITVGEPKEIIGNVAVCTAGTTDIPVAEEAALTAWMCGAEVHRYYDVGVAGLHRLLDQIDDIRAAHAIVAVAGMEGALASVLGGLVDAPIVAVPTSVGYGANFGGLSALLAMLNSCAAGSAVVNIDNGFNAGFMAAKINRQTVKGEDR
ncbi:MAG: nickel pincer cofactor biosynthesis protein LarB [Clostridia bacterium]|nr:nickel pincer cofactor biosynthesis protein LarB [Clostridia bacterium]